MIPIQGQEKKFYPEDIVSIIITHMKKIAEKFLQRAIKFAVATLPESYTEIWKEAFMVAANNAGVRILRVLSKTVAATISTNIRSETEKTFCTVWFGGGTLDINVCKSDDHIFEAISTGGDARLGGQEIDKRIFEYCCDEVKKRTTFHVLKSPKATYKLRKACEIAKNVLSSSESYTIDIESLIDDYDFTLTITRETLNDLCADIFQTIIDHIKTVLKNAEISIYNIDAIFLPGGCSRIPKLISLIDELFMGKKIVRFPFPEECGLAGAAMQACILSGTRPPEFKDFLLIDLIPHSLWIEAEGKLQRIVKKNGPKPEKKTATITTCYDNQTSIAILVYEGESDSPSEDQFLGMIFMNGLQKAAKGVPVIEVTFDIDENNLMKVTAVEKSTNKYEAMALSFSTSMVTDERRSIIDNREEFKIKYIPPEKIELKL